jgi:tripartite-type tricarboxylate transporter receptor subunit TctC
MSAGENAAGRIPYGELIKRMTDFSPTGGCRAVLLPAETPFEQAEKLAEALKMVMPTPPLVIVGNMQALDESAMNAAGWYRK